MTHERSWTIRKSLDEPQATRDRQISTSLIHRAVSSDMLSNRKIGLLRSIVDRVDHYESGVQAFCNFVEETNQRRHELDCVSSKECPDLLGAWGELDEVCAILATSDVSNGELSVDIREAARDLRREARELLCGAAERASERAVRGSDSRLMCPDCYESGTVDSSRVVLVCPICGRVLSFPEGAEDD